MLDTPVIPVVPGRQSLFAYGVLSEAVCADLIHQVERAPILGDGGGPPFPTFRSLPNALSNPAVQAVMAELREANYGWRLPFDDWHVTISEYEKGAYFPEHLDYNADYPDMSPAICFAASVLLVDPSEFTGGLVKIAGQAVPKERGGAAMFHAFTPHSVDPITSGKRVALNVFGTMGKMPDARRAGWPASWVLAHDDPRR
jgi:hypothetical protein